MPCHAAMHPNPPSVEVNTSIEDTLAYMADKKVSYVAVVDENKVLQGLFSYQILFKNLLPVNVQMSDGVNVGVSVRAAPGIAKRLKKVALLSVSDFMNRKIPTVFRDTPTCEGINYIVDFGEPVYVVAQDTGKLVGQINSASAFEELDRLKGEA